MLTTFILLLAAHAATPAPATPAPATPAPTTSGVVQTTVSEPDVRNMKPRDIKAFNQTVSINHPYHIRCTRRVDIGSLVAGTTTCKTNQQWTRVETIGNEDARDIGDKMASKFTQGN